MAGGDPLKAAPAPWHAIRQGEVLAGKYLVDRILGEGGMGVVVAAHHLQLDTRVAIKLLRPELVANPEAVARFTREARAAVRISSERVARVLDVGVLESGSPYMVMEFLEGTDLSAAVARRGPLPVDEVVEYVLQACEAIAEAHSLGIVHRDLKPANLFCIRRPDGTTSIKVLDFGISKVTLGPSDPEMAMTKTTMMMGSPYYMSPEQMQSSRDVDARTDVWALGVILYEAVGGRVPFQGQTLPEVCVRIATQPPAPLLNLRPDAPLALEAVILRCLEKDRDRRYASVAELAAALTDLATPRARLSIETILRTARAAGGAAIPLPAGAITGAGDTGTVGPFGRTTPGASGRRAAAIIGILSAALFIGAFLVLMALHSSGTAHPTSAIASAPATSIAAPRAAASLAQAPAPAETIAPLPSETASARPVAPAPSARRQQAPAAPPAPPPSAKPRPNCDPNFTLDAQGEKHFKPECFR